MSLLTLLISNLIINWINKFILITKIKDKSNNEKEQHISFINLLLTTLFKLFIIVLTIISIFLIWTIPYKILENLLNQFNIKFIQLTEILIKKIFKFFFIFAFSGLIIYLSKMIGDNIFKLLENNEDETEFNEKEARFKTLINVFNNFIKIVIFIFILFSLLQEMGVNITTLLTGAGIVGIAIGFGAQSLIKDFFSGFFILFENQYVVGDVVKIGEISGVVEKITLRITVLRNLEGIVHIIPNGNITTVSNMTFNWSRSIIDITVSYKENVDRVISVLDKISEEFYNDKKWSKLLLKKPEILGVEKLADSGVVIRTLTTTKPVKQWEVMRELNRRIKNCFDQEKIEFAYPHLKIVFDDKAS